MYRNTRPSSLLRAAFKEVSCGSDRWSFDAAQEEEEEEEEEDVTAPAFCEGTIAKRATGAKEEAGVDDNIVTTRIKVVDNR